jgi:hypothetical protein
MVAIAPATAFTPIHCAHPTPTEHLLRGPSEPLLSAGAARNDVASLPIHQCSACDRLATNWSDK